MKRFLKCVPNILSISRIILIVPIVIFYNQGTLAGHITAVVCLVVSALTDFFDGKAARKFDAVSDLGKAIDGAADKLMQIALVACLAIKYGLPVLILLGVLVIKEFFMGLMGLIYLVKTKKVNSAKFHGKLATFVIDVMLIAMFVIMELPEWLVWTLTGICIVFAAYASISYTVMYTKLFCDLKKGIVHEDDKLYTLDGREITPGSEAFGSETTVSVEDCAELEEKEDGQVPV